MDDATTTGPAAAPHVVVVGGGVAGLAAAYYLRRPGAGGGPVPRVTVLEGGPRTGGALKRSPVAGVEVDEGAEALLARRPEAVELIDELGLTGETVRPGTTSAHVWTRDAVRPLPGGHVMGVPGDLAELARSGVLSTAGLARAGLDLTLPATPVDADVPVAAYVGGRLGAEVVDRLVEPMLGGVYAGRADRLSLAATLPQIHTAARTHRSLLGAVAELRAAAPTAGGPVFVSLRGGVARLADALADASGARVRTSAMVRELARTPGGWRLTVGSAHRPEHTDADAVVLAVPAAPAARLLRPHSARAARLLGEIEYASVAVVTLAYRPSAFPEPLPGSGFLVPAVDGRSIKAATFSTAKWPALAEQLGGTVLVRCSLGRIGEERLLQRPDEELVALAMHDLAAAVGVRELPLETRVSRWGGALPQYTVGHLDRVAGVRAAAAELPALAVCGAAYAGLGVPAVLGTARAAAEQIHGRLAAARGRTGR
ncbi:protoporphyrinogen oxidase [Allonocardiopsis opalescens]|uniref:Coproporphyrinogen III oxidase n=1 Tax=Allonocardiopsis opalescens TaxID=1144618 RepID=A0A2T0PU12_9ACTN|nr:protoporphyrinogen oxidase [Allonocardiopsis opalescens]PRX92383.1 UDP-galactopyranose mutase [Allonocardiopsis opalescens]